MEEADALASRAGIMSKGMLAMGTTSSLRNRFGDAYHIHLVTKTAPHTPPAEMERIKLWVTEHFPDATIEEKTYHGQMRFAVPARRRGQAPSSPSSPIVQTAHVEKLDEICSTPVVPEMDENESRRRKGNISMLFTLLEANKEVLGLEYYSVSRTTLDQVFLKIVGQHQIEEEGYAVPKRGFWARALCGNY
jgi:ABC-type multidrug transport system ATPase subunit